MERENNQKIKMLLLEELLEKKTDIGHPLTTNQIIRELKKKGITCDRRTLSKDIELLNDSDYEVLDTRVHHEKAYYVPEREFDDSELRIMIDAVQSAKCITPEKTKEFVNKLADLSSEHDSALLKNNLVDANIFKHNNEQIYDIIYDLEKAINRKKSVSFRYFDIDENGEVRYRGDNHIYHRDPIALIYDDGEYYLKSWSQHHYEKGEGGLANFRLDRMRDVQIEDTDICDMAIKEMDNIPVEFEKTFRMYSGEEEDVVLELKRRQEGVKESISQQKANLLRLFGEIQDKYGEDTRFILQKASGNYITTVPVEVSPTFYAWVFTFDGAIEILAPQSVVKEYKKLAKDMLEGMNE